MNIYVWITVPIWCQIRNKDSLALQKLNHNRHGTHGDFLMYLNFFYKAELKSWRLPQSHFKDKFSCRGVNWPIFSSTQAGWWRSQWLSLLSRQWHVTCSNSQQLVGYWKSLKILCLKTYICITLLGMDISKFATLTSSLLSLSSFIF